MDAESMMVEAVEPVESIQAGPSYWATWEPEKLLPEIEERIQAYYDYLRTAGRIDLWQRMHEQMTRGVSTGGQLGVAGEQGELTTLDLNEIGNLYQHTLNLITSQRLEFESMAANSDHASQAQAITGNAVIEYANRTLGMDRRMVQAVGFMLRYAEAALWVDWDVNAGPDYRPDETGRIQKAGDVRFQTLHPIDLIRDPSLSEYDDASWVCARVWRNRFDMMARYPDVAKDISGVDGRRADSEDKRPRLSDVSMRNPQDGPEPDEVAVYYWYHKKTDALPQGRMVVYLAPDVLLFDGPLPFRREPLIRMAAADIDDEPFGYTQFYDLLAPQIAVDSVVSTVTSNHASFGVQSIWQPSGSELELKRLARGLNLLKGGTAPPQPLQLLASSPETYKLYELLEAAMERISGINSTVRGNPEASLKSGTALALVYSQTIQFIGLAQRAYHLAAERVGTLVVECYQEFSEVERQIIIEGEQSRSYAIALQKGGLSAIDRVTVRVANPLTGTIAGRIQLAESMLQNSLIKDPHQYMMVLETGRLENMTEAPVRERMNIRAENERLSRGEVPQAVFLDNHLLHIQEHSTVLASPESRETLNVVQACQQHIQQHIDLWKTTDPNILSAIGVPPPPSGSQPQAPPGGAPQGGGQPEAPLQVPEPQGGDTNPIAASGARMPSAPKNPATGERMQLPGVNA
jgi:hypothetical protein